MNRLSCITAEVSCHTTASRSLPRAPWRPDLPPRPPRKPPPKPAPLPEAARSRSAVPASFSRPSCCCRAMTSCRRARLSSPSGSNSPRWRRALASDARFATLASVGYRFRRSFCHLPHRCVSQHPSGILGCLADLMLNLRRPVAQAVALDGTLVMVWDMESFEEGATYLWPSAISAALRGFQGLAGLSSNSTSFCFLVLPCPALCWLCF